MIHPGQIVRDYEVVSPLGRGGIATVFLVRHRATRALAALKVLHVESGRLRQRMLREAWVQSEIAHTNVIAVYDVLEIDGALALVMELARGPSLQPYLAARSPTIEHRDALVRGILSGVGAAHKLGVVHRDLKPGNVLLDVGRSCVTAKICDFGIMKLVASEEASLTAIGAQLGTPAYTAPEQFLDASNVGPYTDVFSLGTLMYEMMLGVSPFPGTSFPEVSERVLQGTYRPPKEVDPALPDRMAEAIAKALQRDPAARPPDANALLRLWEASSPVPDPTWSKRARTEILCLAPAMQDKEASREMPVPGSIDFTRFDRMLSTVEETRAQPSQRARSQRWMAASLLLVVLGLIALYLASV